MYAAAAAGGNLFVPIQGVFVPKHLTKSGKKTDDESRVFFVITNSSDDQGDARSQFHTTKMDVKNHGLGIKSMRKTLKKYDGILDFSYTNGMCTLRFTMQNKPFIPV